MIELRKRQAKSASKHGAAGVTIEHPTECYGGRDRQPPSEEGIVGEGFSILPAVDDGDTSK